MRPSRLTFRAIRTVETARQCRLVVGAASLFGKVRGRTAKTAWRVLYVQVQISMGSQYLVSGTLREPGRFPADGYDVNLQTTLEDPCLVSCLSSGPVPVADLHPDDNRDHSNLYRLDAYLMAGC